MFNPESINKAESKIIILEVDAKLAPFYVEAAEKAGIGAYTYSEGFTFNENDVQFTVREGDKGVKLYSYDDKKLAKFWKIEKGLESQQ